jgi:signal transduction histidine kinase
MIPFAELIEEFVEGLILIGLIISLLLLVKARKYTEKLNQKNIDLKNEYKSIMKKKNTFLATASHDLQQPHQALGLFLASINMERLDFETINIINKAKDAHVTISKLLNQLLNISRLDSAEKPELKRIALHELVHSIGMKFMPIASSYGVELRIRVRDAYVMSDPVMLERMLTNILLNAFRHAKKANVLIAIRKRTIDNTKHWQIEVYDTGIGIPNDQQQLIFQEFTKLSKPETSPTGLGLGLAIVKRLSHILEHPVGVRSRLGSGSCFYISLKAVKPKVIVPVEPSIDSVIRKRLRVLVINEHNMLRDSLKTLLNSWGCQANACKSSNKALQNIKKEGWIPDALIIDGTLQNTTLNIQDIQDIRSLSRQDMPMILITNNAKNTFSKEAKRFGFTLLENPLQASALREILGDRP